MKSVRGVGSGEVDSRTRALRWDHSVVGRSVAATAFWSWDGGDAIVVEVGYVPNAETWVVLRLGEVVRALPACGLKEALAQVGEDPSAYVIE
jgi:hypothetical protein